MSFRDRVLGAIADRLLTTPRGQEVVKSVSTPSPTKKSPKTQTWSPWSFLGDMGKYRDRISPLTFETLRRMAYSTPVVAAIINTRVNQVAAFSTHQRDRFSLGYKIRMREVDRPPRAYEKKEIARLEKYITNCGAERDKRRQTFESFLKQITRDSLMFDQYAFEIVPDRAGRPSYFVPVDASTIRMAGIMRDTVGNVIPGTSSEFDYVQVIDYAVRAEYTINELAVGIRNPRTDIRANGYGFSELEMLINIVTAMLFADEYNKTFFSKGSAPKGILLIKGSIDENNLEAFKRQWWAQVRSIENAWRTPIISTEEEGEIQWLSMQMTNREMEYRTYLDYLTRVACAVYLIDPAEINFDKGATPNQVTFESKQEQRVKYSRDRGLRPLLKHIVDTLNHNLVWELNDDFELVFEGLNTLSKEELSELVRGEVQYFRTVNEVREERDLSPLSEEQGGDMILNQIIHQAQQAKEQAKQQQQMAAQQGGMPGAGGAPPPEAGGNGQMPPETAKTLFDMSPEELQQAAKSISASVALQKGYSSGFRADELPDVVFEL